MNSKEVAARAAVARIQHGMTVGLGSGTTVDCALAALGERVREGLDIRLVVASSRSQAAARAAGLPFLDLDAVDALDLLIDGADELDARLSLIKGGGAALVREKLLAVAAREFLVVADAGKRVERLGAFPLPVAVVPFGSGHTLKRLQRLCPAAALRMDGDRPLATDDGLAIIDLPLREIPEAADLERRIKAEVGVVEVGLFVGLAHRAILGYADGRTEELLPAA
jgi:ribose 5-phosphate isomerase A